MSELLASDLITPDAGETPLLSLPSVSILKAAPMTRLSLRCREAAQRKPARHLVPHCRFLPCRTPLPPSGQRSGWGRTSGHC